MPPIPRPSTGANPTVPSQRSLAQTPASLPPGSEPAPIRPLPTRGGIGQEGFDLVELKSAEGHALYLKGRLSGHIFRFSLARDPAQARLWCLFVEHCAAVGTIGQRIDGVIGPGNLTREEALTALRELADNPTKWLGQRRRQGLLAWLQASGNRGENAASQSGTR